MSSSFATYTAIPAAAPNPAKHVNYTLGMVMGVADFDQEFAYLNNRDQWAVRDLIGYGTVWGLRISNQPNSVIQVDPGGATAPSGQLIRVCKTQCANLGTWLADSTNLAAVTQHLVTAPVVLRDFLRVPILPPIRGAPIPVPITGPAPDATVALHVVLCYRDCDTDAVPIPGDPCRCDDQTTAPSRIADDFCLEIRLVPPVQHEEDAIRRFVAWLRAIPVATPRETPSTLFAFETAVRNLETLLSPPSSPPANPDWDLNFGSPPASLSIPVDQACEYLRLAMRIWTTELRPKWRAAFAAGGCGCGCGGAATDAGSPEDCVLLATVTVGLVKNLQNSTWLLDTAHPIYIDETRRPFLLNLRMIQEWLLCGSCECQNEVIASPPESSPPAEKDLLGDVTGLPESNQISALQGEMVVLNKPPGTNNVLTFDGHKWTDAPIPAVAPPPPVVLAGDVTGPATQNTVTKIQSVKVAAGTPADGQVLTYNASQGTWLPATPAAPVAPQGPFVQHPATRGAYSIAAAGSIGTAFTPNVKYNNLRMTAATATSYRFIFDGYSPGNSYIVKAMPQLSKSDSPLVIVNVGEFGDQNTGILLNFSGVDGKPVSTDQKFNLLVEVSQYAPDPQ